MSNPEFARTQLLGELREISFQLTRTQWDKDVQFKVWAVLSGDTDKYNGKPLANPLLAHIDALETYGRNAGGWPAGETVESYVDTAEWQKLYEGWKANNPV